MSRRYQRYKFEEIAPWPVGRSDSDNNATQPAGAGAWLSVGKIG